MSTKYVVLLILLVAALIGLPWLVFWAIGVLFGHSIPYTLKTVLALYVLAGTMQSGRAK